MKRDLFFVRQFFVTHVLFTLEAMVVSSKRLIQVSTSALGNLKSLCREHGFTLVHKVYYLKYQLSILFHGKILNAFALEKGYL